VDVDFKIIIKEQVQASWGVGKRQSRARSRKDDEKNRCHNPSLLHTLSLEPF